MQDWSIVSERIQGALNLAQPPVAVTFTDSIPADIKSPARSAPAGCSFWELGASSTVATSAEDHQFCSIGIHTHNLDDAPSGQSHELETALGAMQGLDYVRPAEVEALPVMANSSKHVIYGPLGEATEQPSVVLLFANASESLVVTEAIARVDDAIPLAMGRPACALIPQVVNSNRSASSLGCCGARTYLDTLTDNITLWALAGDKLEAYADAIETLAGANKVLTQFHQMRKVAIDCGQTPTVAQSLAALK